MDSLRSVRFLAIVAIFAMLLAAIVPFSAAAQTADEAGRGFAMATPTGVMDCKTCPKADMALGRCVQMACQVATIAAGGILSKAIVLVRYRLAIAARPPEWHTVPPVSPG